MIKSCKTAYNLKKSLDLAPKVLTHKVNIVYFCRRKEKLYYVITYVSKCASMFVIAYKLFEETSKNDHTGADVLPTIFFPSLAIHQCNCKSLKNC